MSRSRSKRNKIKVALRISDKLARSKANRKLRKIVKILLKKDEEHFPKLREVSDTWDFPSDGLSFYHPIIGTKLERR